MSRRLAALVVALGLLAAGCRDGATPVDPVTDQFDGVESTLSAIESDLDGD